jgi:hypothetical protein
VDFQAAEVVHSLVELPVKVTSASSEALCVSMACPFQTRTFLPLT